MSEEEEYEGKSTMITRTKEYNSHRQNEEEDEPADVGLGVTKTK